MFRVTCAFLLVVTAGGGSSRADVLSLLYLRPIAVAMITFFIWRTVDWRLIRPLAILLASLATIIAAQLVPLPPAIIHLLPGRGRLDLIQQLNDTVTDWHPLSLDPDATLNALLSLVVPGAMLVALGTVGEAGRQRLLPIVIAILVAGGMLGVAQVASGQDSWFYLYRLSYPGFAVGWFSNRNHDAVALACLFPLVRVWAARRNGTVLTTRARAIVGLTIVALVPPLILITGSRAGLILGVVGIVASLVILPPPTITSSRQRRSVVIAAAALIAAIGLVAIMQRTGHAASVDRLLRSTDLGGEGRVAYLGTEWRALRQFWPWGMGVGAFDPAIRMIEPDELLATTYFNHAHDDFLEMVMTAGLPALALMVVALAMLARWTVLVFRPYRTGGEIIGSARAGAVMLWLILAASTVDYPLRSPLMATIATIAAVWLRGGVAERLRLRSSEVDCNGSSGRSGRQGS